MVADSERRYTGTNFAVITMAVLLMAVLIYMGVAEWRDASNDGIDAVSRHAAVR